jgi:hypothetical protein
MSAIPSKLISLKTLSQVPVSEYADIRPPKDCTDQQQRAGFFKLLRQKPKNNQTKSHVNVSQELLFNAAVWLNFPQPLNKPVSLWLSYKDATGENTILVDEQALKGTSSAMLSGTVSIRVKGHLEYLRASCGGVAVDERFHIEELYVRRLRDSVSQKSRNFQTLMAS